ncbi:MAG TPA: winged helix-turn-helix domain-containing protein [Candidatus Angelobacter sp.]|nr:winged helix-turn-helix domain-containing protein [Candidatus Angelobacter sp.]
MPNTYAFGPFRFETRGLLTRKGKQVHLTPKEAAVLRVLLENAGSVVEKDEFQKKVWPEIRLDIQFDNCLKRAIATLRRALDDPKSKSLYIQTLSKLGYLFHANVTLMPEAMHARLKIVVLPFRAIARRQHPKEFIDLTEDVTIQLGRLNPQRLGVIAFSTARRYKNTKKTIAQIGEELGVGYVLEGGVLRSGNRVRVSVQLSLVTDESQLWGETYEREWKDIPVLLRELGQDVARALQVKLVSHEQARLDYVAPVVPEAYKSYLDGRYLWNKRTPESLRDAIALFEKAIALDASFALAYSALADCYAVIASQSWMPPKQACDKAKSAATKASSFDPTLAEPHAALGFVLSVFEHDWAKAEQEFQQALRLNTNCATAHQWYSFYLAARNRLSEALQQMKLAQEIDPYSRMIKTNVGTMLYWARDYDGAIEQYDQALRLDSDFWYAYWMRGLAYDEKKQYRQAAADQRRAQRYCPEQSSLLTASLSRSLALAGDQVGARRQLKEAKAAGRSTLAHYHFAVAHAALGDKDAAFRTLLESSSAHEMWVSFVQVDSKIDSLRNDRRYQELVRAIF